MVAGNIKQITNKNFSIDLNNFRNIEIGNKTLKVFYQTKNFPRYVSKFGYSCSPNGIGIPVFLIEAGGNIKEFVVGKTGIFEFQPIPTQIDDKEVGLIEEEAKVRIEGIKVPLAIDNDKNLITFVIDYIEEEEINIQ